jgi:hypothetical protein
MRDIFISPSEDLYEYHSIFRIERPTDAVVLQLYCDRLYDDKSSSSYAIDIKAAGGPIRPVLHLSNAGISTRII